MLTALTALSAVWLFGCGGSGEGEDPPEWTPEPLSCEVQDCALEDGDTAVHSWTECLEEVSGPRTWCAHSECACYWREGRVQTDCGPVAEDEGPCP